MKTESAYNNFSWNLAAQYLNGTTKNACISPPGIYLLLSAIAAASDGATKRELDHALSGTVDLEDLWGENHVENIRWLNDLLRECTVLSNSSTIQIPEKYELLEDYRAKMTDAFGNGLDIRKISGDEVVLQNLITFRDKWDVKFLETERKFYEGPYVPSAQQSSYGGLLGKNMITSAAPEEESGKLIPYIYQKELSLNVNETADYISVIVPFSSDCHLTLSMPKNRELASCLGAAEVMRQTLNVRAGRSEKVDLYLPSFKIKDRLLLIPVLKAMGAHEVFDKYQGRITGMVNDRLYITSGEQETEVEVNAEGASAKAFTTFRCNATASMESNWMTSREIHFDHPFLFLIWQTKPVPIPLFIGTFQKAE